MILADIYHMIGQDIGVTPTGDINTVTGNDRTTQRILRRLFTAATTADHSPYPFEPDYGIGLGERVGDVTPDLRAIHGLVRSQMLQEASVARQPAPVIDVQEILTGGVVISIAYVDLSGSHQQFSFNFS